LFEEFRIIQTSRSRSESNASATIEPLSTGDCDWDHDDDEDCLGQEDRVQHYVDNYDGEVDNSVVVRGEEEEEEEDESAWTQCACRMRCIEQFQHHSLNSHMLSMQELEKDEKELFIMGSLQKNDNDTQKGRKRQRIRYSYKFQVCKPAFCYINCISENTLKRLSKHMECNGPVPRVHGNKSRKPHHAHHYEEMKHCVQYLLTYADVHGLPMPAAPGGHNEEPPVLLPSCLTKQELHTLYASSCAAIPIRALGTTSFKEVWNTCLPHIKIIGPRDDVCGTCEQLKKKIMDATTEDDKLVSTTAFTEHVQVYLLTFQIKVSVKKSTLCHI